MPRKDNQRSYNNRNNSSSAHYERSDQNPNRNNIPDAPTDYAKILENTTIGPEDSLKRAQSMNALGEFPIIGPFVKAYEGNKYLEDYYRNTGMLPRYPVNNTPGNGGAQLVNAVSNVARTATSVMPGTNDLYQFYAGEPDNFRSIMNGMYM